MCTGQGSKTKLAPLFLPMLDEPHNQGTQGEDTFLLVEAYSNILKKQVPIYNGHRQEWKKQKANKTHPMIL